MSEEKIIISADGTRIGYTDEGHGMPIVIVHGGSSDISHWERVARALSGSFRIIRIERRLYARDRQARSPHAIQREIEDLAALFACIGEPAVLLGHSSGGVVALETALQHQSALAGLILYEPPVAVTRPLGGDALVRAREALAHGNMSQALMIHLRDIVKFPLPLVLLIRLSPGWKELCAVMPAQIADNEAIEALGVGIQRYARLTMPTLLFGGTRSPAHLRERLAALGQVIPQAQSTLIRGQGHMANLEAPEQVAQLVREFAEEIFSATPSQPERARC
jgi:pimeloyl-ACP methyl ester carboxylesterase